MPPTIRSALLAELAPAALHDIFKLRGDVFVVEQDCPYPDLDGRDGELGAMQFWAEVDGEVVACLRRLDEPDGSVRVGRIATRADHRGEGVAAALLDAALEGVEGPVVLDAQLQLEDWYARLGFVRDGPTFVEDGIPHLPMRRPPVTTALGDRPVRRVTDVAAGAPYDRRVDPLTGETSVIVAKRQSRPNLGDGTQTAVTGCPFCPGGIEAPEHYDVKAFTNRWPSIPDDRCEVVLYAPDHDASLASLGAAGARRVIGLWAERTEALGARHDVDYVLVFENRGPEVGATIPHPHGQIYAFPDVPPAPLAELASGACTTCDEQPDGRLVAEIGGWRAWVPQAATWPYALLAAPLDHVADLPALDDHGRDGLAAVLVDSLARLDRLFDAPMPYMLWIHQRPTDGGAWPTAHLHLHLAPLYRAPGTQRFVAAGELGSGVFFNPVDPEDAAAALRDA